MSGRVSQPRNHFHQMQVAGRIEEVRRRENAPEIHPDTLRDLRERNAAGVGRDDGARGAMRNHPVVERAFDGEILGYGFDDPVAVFDLRKVVIESAGGNEPADSGMKNAPGRPLRAVVAQPCRGGRYRAAAMESARWQDARRCGNPWSRLQERRHGELASLKSPVREYLMRPVFSEPRAHGETLREQNGPMNPEDVVPAQHLFGAIEQF